MIEVPFWLLFYLVSVTLVAAGWVIASVVEVESIQIDPILSLTVYWPLLAAIAVVLMPISLLVRLRRWLKKETPADETESN